MWLPESGQIEANHAYEAHKDRHRRRYAADSSL